jgi:hypothetical protein
MNHKINCNFLATRQIRVYTSTYYPNKITDSQLLNTIKILQLYRKWGLVTLPLSCSATQKHNRSYSDLEMWETIIQELSILRLIPLLWWSQKRRLYGSWHCPIWGNCIFCLLLIIHRRIASELTAQNFRYFLFTPKNAGSILMRPSHSEF